MRNVPMYNVCKEPDRQELALYDPAGDWHGYHWGLVSARRHWQLAMLRARERGPGGWAHVAEFLHQRLDVATEWLLYQTESHVMSDQARLFGLGTLALSRLMRDIAKGGSGPRERGAPGILRNVYLDCPTTGPGVGETAAYFAPTVIPKNLFPPDAPADGWYSKEGLLVHRTQPPLPSSGFAEQQVLPLAAFSDEPVALYPYLPSVPHVPIPPDFLVPLDR